MLQQSTLIGVGVSTVLAVGVAFLMVSSSHRSAADKLAALGSPVAVVSDLRVYPVKSLRGHSLKEAEVDALGLINDRRWMVAVAPPPGGTPLEPARFLTQRQLPAFATLTPYVLTLAAFDAAIACIDDSHSGAVSAANVIGAARDAAAASAAAAASYGRQPVWFPVPSSSAPSASAVALLITVDREHNAFGARGIAAAAAAAAAAAGAANTGSPLLKPTHFTLALEEIAVLCASSRVFIAGSFNAWHADAAALVWDQASSAFTGDLLLPPGVHTYKFVIDGEWLLSSTCAIFVDGAGYRNHAVTVAGPRPIGPERWGDDWVLIPLIRAAAAPPSALSGARIWSDTIKGAVDQGSVAGAWLRAVAIADGEVETEDYGLPALARLRLLYIDSESDAAARPLVNRYMPPGLGLSQWLNPAAGARRAAAAGGTLLAKVTRALLSPFWRLAAGGAAAAQTSFADGFPILLASEVSLVDLNARMSNKGGLPLAMERFRPNLVVCAAPGEVAPSPWAEDSWADMIIRPSQLRIRGVKRCSRCSVTTTDQTTGIVGGMGTGTGTGSAAASSQSAVEEAADEAEAVKPAPREPLATLSTFRSGAPPCQDEVFFGVNIVHDFEAQGMTESHTIRVGDEIALINTCPIKPL